MGKSKKRQLTKEQRRELWKMWRMGKSHQPMANHMGIQRPSAFMYTSKYGGIEPSQQTRSATVLSDLEREEISRGLRADLSLREIAKDLGRSPSTISREVRRHGGRGRYRASRADKQTWKTRADRSQADWLVTNDFGLWCRTSYIRNGRLNR